MTVYGGDVIYAADLNAALALLPVSVTKSADTGRTSTTTVSADPHLLITVPASKTYTMIAVIGFNGDSAGDMKGGFYVPSGGTITGTMRTQNATASATAGSIVTDLYSGSTGFQFGCIGTGTSMTALCVATVASGTGGNLGFTWAQVSSSATATTVKAGSFITLLPTG